MVDLTGQVHAGVKMHGVVCYAAAGEGGRSSGWGEVGWGGGEGVRECQMGGEVEV